MGSFLLLEFNHRLFLHHANCSIRRCLGCIDWRGYQDQIGRTYGLLIGLPFKPDEKAFETDYSARGLGQGWGLCNYQTRLEVVCSACALLAFSWRIVAAISS